jgi:hypothetical protein
MYGAFEGNELSKIFDIQKFQYIKLTFGRPLHLNFNVLRERIKCRLIIKFLFLGIII